MRRKKINTILPIYKKIRAIIYKKIMYHKNKYQCPICNYCGPFINIKSINGPRKNSKCPKCSSFETHRLQYLVINSISKEYNFSKMVMLHFAPESFFRIKFFKIFKKYVTADLNMDDVDYKVDLRNLPFNDEEYDLILASYVLEHIKGDDIALAEIKRILKPGGIAILPVPILVSGKTIEYNEVPYKGHYRAPGLDYYEKYKDYFRNIKIYYSSDFEKRYQTYIYEDRSYYPINIPRPPMKGDKHLETVPLCYK